MSEDTTHGGKRVGAGRKYGSQGRGPSRSKTARIAEIIDQNRLSLTPIVGEAIANMSPLDIMLHAAALEAKKGNWTAAAGIARDACPYVHAKLSSVDITGTVETKNAEDMSDKELIAMIRDQAATRSVELNDKAAH